MIEPVQAQRVVNQQSLQSLRRRRHLRQGIGQHTIIRHMRMVRVRPVRTPKTLLRKVLHQIPSQNNASDVGRGGW